MFELTDATLTAWTLEWGWNHVLDILMWAAVLRHRDDSCRLP